MGYSVNTFFNKKNFFSVDNSLDLMGYYGKIFIN
jgi:hypothetical protein